jgi:hypothetical protein
LSDSYIDGRANRLQSETPGKQGDYEMPTIIRRLTGAIVLPAAAAGIIGGAVLGLAGTANASIDPAGKPFKIAIVQNDGPAVPSPSNKKPYWNDKRGYYNNDKGGYY